MSLALYHCIPVPRNEENTKYLEYFTLDELAHNPAFIQRHNELITDIEEIDEDENPYLTKGIYYKEIGYQSSGMKREFFQDFQDCYPYFYKSDVIKASRYLVTSWGRVPKDLRLNFQANFIDNFKEGESIFFASW